ncbi:MAG: hypothetical protein Q8O97_02745 [bacterium]|nr:hypothetical protein [Candidatus Wildermuthbacteria bacterium]MDP2664850.1 hypothetical protein [bacterium]
MKISTEQLRFVRKDLVHLPRVLAEHAFFFTLFLMALAVAISFLAFFLSSASLRKSPEASLKASEFQQKMFEEVFERWEEREANFAKPRTQNIPNIFD